MPITTNTLSALRRLAGGALAYAVGTAIAAGFVLPTILTPLPVTALMPEPAKVVARTPAGAP